MTFANNPYDGHSLVEALDQTSTLTGAYPKTATVDRGYKGIKSVETTTIIKPSKPLKRENQYQRGKKRKHCRRRAAIEPIISHIKHDHRALRNYLKGINGDQINFIMAASAFNYKELMKKLRVKALWLHTLIHLWKSVIENQVLNINQKTNLNLKMTF